MRIAVQVRQLYLIPLLAAAAIAVGIAAAPPAAAELNIQDCGSAL
jgi:hypothetical protein